MAWEIPDEEISSACENEFDTQDSFLLVQEILEARKANKQLQAENKRLKKDSKWEMKAESWEKIGVLKHRIRRRLMRLTKVELQYREIKKDIQDDLNDLDLIMSSEDFEKENNIKIKEQRGWE